MDSFLLNIIMVIFPMLIYFIYNCYRELRSEKYNYLIMDIALISSLYLCFKYGGFLSLLFCNIPIIIAYLNKRVWSAVVLSLICIIYFYVDFELNIFLIVIKLLVYLIVYLISEMFNISDKKYMIGILIVVSFFVSFEYFSVVNDNYIINLGLIFLFMILFYVTIEMIVKLFILGSSITSLYMNIYELEREKKLRSSLFKITHEVKNPIAVCKGYLEMFDFNNQKKAKKYISIIKNELDRSLGIMSDFMEFNKINISKEIIDINLLLEEIDEEFKIFVKNKRIDFICKYMRDEIFVDGDYNRLKQVFINLIKNSIEAIEGSGRIEVIAHSLKGYYYIEINDNGKGMDIDDVKRVKEMFFTTKLNGSGLGVSLSDEIIRAHNGTMEYSSKVGIGTKVIVKLPIIML